MSNNRMYGKNIFQAVNEKIIIFEYPKNRQANRNSKSQDGSARRFGFGFCQRQGYGVRISDNDQDQPKKSPVPGRVENHATGKQPQFLPQIISDTPVYGEYYSEKYEELPVCEYHIRRSNRDTVITTRARRSCQWLCPAEGLWPCFPPIGRSRARHPFRLSVRRHNVRQGRKPAE